MRGSKITLENVEQYSVPLEEHPMQWVFEREPDKKLSEEFRDQIIPLTKEAAKFLWDFEMNQKVFGVKFFNGEFFKDMIEFPMGSKSGKEVKKWLFDRGIQFEKKVFWVSQPNSGFVLTWKMVIKFWDSIFFGRDTTIWDQTLNWGLAFHHDDVFYFGKNRIYNSNIEGKIVEENTRLIEEARKEIESRKKQENETGYYKNPFRK